MRPLSPSRVRRADADDGFLDRRGPGWWSLRELARAGKDGRTRSVAIVWVLTILVSIASGILNVRLGWNGVELAIAGIPFDVTIYPAFVLSVLVALWLGPAWAAVPIYLANFASAVTAGLGVPMAALFALAGVVETLMLWGSLVALRVDPDLRRLRDVAWFLGAGLVAAVTGSLAAILWNSVQGLDPDVGQRIWRGWVLGDLLQLVVVVVPVLRFAGPRLRGRLDRQFLVPPLHDFSYLHGVGLVVVGFAILGLVVFLGVHQALESIEIALDARTADGDLLLPRLREIVLAMALLSTALIVATGMFSTALARLGERQRAEAVRDTLTGCFNRRGFAQAFAIEAERSRRLGLGLGVLFLDLDRFKRLNDEHGHDVGDLVLRSVARRLEHAMRETDLLFRWGGEEFVILMPHSSGEEIERVAERVRQAVAGSPAARTDADGAIALTVSIGATTAQRGPFDPEELVRRADEACYEAKELGRDRVVVAG